MSKVSELVSKVFRTKSRLETDAVPTEASREQSETQNTINLPTEVNNGNSRDFILPTQSAELVPLSAGSLTSTESSVNNNLTSFTQGYNVLQISGCKGVHLGSVSVFNLENSAISLKGTTKEQKQQIPRTHRTRTIDEMIKSKDNLNHRSLQVISMHLGEGWQIIMRILGFSEGQIHQFKVDNFVDGGLQEVIYQMLLDWSRNDDDATLGKITEVLWRNGQRHTVMEMKKWYKTEKVNANTENSGNDYEKTL